MPGSSPGGPIDPAALRPVDLTPDHAAAGFALSTTVGWNQTLADWTYMLGAGEGVGLIAPDGRLVVTAMALPYERFAWICMVLVDPGYRRLGLATRVMDEVVSRQVAAGRVPGLDATPDGREVYRRIGFRDLYRLGRYRAEEAPEKASGPASGELGQATSIQPMIEKDLAALAEMDCRVFGADRGALLAHLKTRVPDAARVAWHDNEPVGYVVARDGREAHQIGPLVARDASIATALAAAALSEIAGPVYFDVPDAQTDFVSWLVGCGFAMQRPFFRMVRGQNEGFDDPGDLFAMAGPELG